MSEATPTPFEVLGVPPDVDDATLKKAYFRKLREYPPETHPTEYQRVHEAFELLRDPDRRRAIAERLAGGGLPAELQALLSQVDAAMREKNVQGAIEVLRTVAEKFPDFEPARVMLARQLAGLQRSAEALTHAKALCEKNPTSVPALLLFAEIQMETYEYVSAREAIAKAKELDPNDRRPLLVEAMMLAQMEKYDESLTLLERALILTDKRYVPDAQLIAHRVVMQTERGHPTAMKFEVERIVVGAKHGKQEPAEAASMLVQLAGVVLSKGHPELAREILSNVSALAPERRAIDVSVPREVKLTHLPEATQKAVAEIRAKPPPHVVVLDARQHLAPLALLTGSLGMLAISTILVFSVGASLVTVGAMALGVGGAISGWQMHGRASRGGKAVGSNFFEVRPFHLIEVVGSTVRVVPLLSLTGIRTRSGGATLVFERGVQPIELDGATELYRLLQSVLDQRARLVSLMTSDLIETEQQLEPLAWGATPASA